MKRNMDLIREILFSLEKSEEARISKNQIIIEGYNQNQIQFHITIMEEAKLILHEVTTGYMSGSKGICPTMAGYDFIDSTRDPEVWQKTKEGALKAGGWSLDLLGELAKGLMKQKIEVMTGVKL
jgi:Hypothetical protein (DUF2513)